MRRGALAVLSPFRRPYGTGADLFRRVQAGDRRALGQALTLVESQSVSHRPEAEELMAEVIAHPRPSFRVGISGAPGAGKSTFIDALGLHLVEQGHRVAVMAVDPSSYKTGGSILGDKTRMERLSMDDRAFVRPSPSKGHLGGVTANAYEGVLLFEAAGYDVVLIETVGVGQSEVAVADLADTFLLLIPPSSGDELQGIKKGIVEVADIVCITKADGTTLDHARQALTHYTAAVRLLCSHSEAWEKRVILSSAKDLDTLKKAWGEIERHRQVMEKEGLFHRRRQHQRHKQLWNHVQVELVHRLKTWPGLRQRVGQLEAQVLEGRVAPRRACSQILELLLQPLAQPGPTQS